MNDETATLEAMGAAIESEWETLEMLETLEARELNTVTAARNSMAARNRAARIAARNRAARAAVTVSAGHALNRDGALGVVSIVKVDGAASLATVVRYRGSVDVAPLATVDGITATVYPVADTHANRVKLWQSVRTLEAMECAAIQSEIGRDTTAPDTAERSAYDRASRDHARMVERRAAIGDVGAEARETLVQAIQDVAAARVRSRKHGETYALKLRRTHRVDMAVKKQRTDDRAAALADVLIGIKSKRAAGETLTAREVATVIGRPLTPTERKVMQRTMDRPADEVATLRGTDTAAHRLANSLRRQ